ncbi:MAG: fasciclin domain-containing protein [Paludibacteraceae bacterium]
MKLKYFETTVITLIILFSFSFNSCKDEWDQHYNDVSLAEKSDLNLYDFIKSKENLSTFAKMLELTGYDKLLSSSQVFTVWAPDNQALQGIDPTNKTLALEIVKNYVARYSYTTSGVVAATVPMLNGKLLSFAKLGSAYVFNKEEISTSDLGASNGILHILSGYAPYKMNIWEYINQENGLDSLKKYVNSLSIKTLDSVASYDKNGILLDSVFKIENAVLKRLGSLNVEDSIYTAFLPDNLAWTELYSRIAPYYKTLKTDGGDAQQRATIQWTIVKNLFFRDKKTSSESKLTSTGGIDFFEPASLFENTQSTELSNGLAYKVSPKWNVKDTASWHKPLKFEAEYLYEYNNIVKTTFVSNYTPSVMTSLGTNFVASNKYFLSLRDVSTSSLSKLYAIFPIPYTLSAKYNVYCVFLPKKILDPNDARPYKVKFTINYLNSAGVTTPGYVDVNNTIQSSVNSQATFITDPTKIDKMLVAKNVTLPFSNMVFNGKTSEDLIKQIKFSLKVENATAKSGTDITLYSRDIYIDCIILEPVQ